MKIVTVNIEESQLELIKKLIGNTNLYPSRSELIRACCRKLLLKELKGIKEEKIVKQLDDPNELNVQEDIAVHPDGFLYECPRCKGRCRKPHINTFYCQPCYSDFKHLTVRLEYIKEEGVRKEIKSYKILKRLEK